MASTLNPSIRRLRAAFAAAVVVAGLAVAGSVPARAAASTTAPTPRACVPGKIVDFCRAVPPGPGFRLANGVFTTIDGPGASLTVPYRSNNRGQVVGAYVVADGTPGGRTHGFVLDNGKVRTLDGPGRSPTELFGIDDRGRIVGTYQDARGTTHGLLLDRGTVRILDFPGSKETVLYSINDRGRIVGGYRDAGGKVVACCWTGRLHRLRRPGRRLRDRGAGYQRPTPDRRRLPLSSATGGLASDPRRSAPAPIAAALGREPQDAVVVRRGVAPFVAVGGQHPQRPVGRRGDVT
jgi:hypothetical protein